MAKVNKRTPRGLIKRAIDAIQDGLTQMGISWNDVDWEKVQATKLHRIIVIASGFEHMPFTERQQVVWRIIERALSPKDQLMISMILTLTPEEAKPDNRQGK